MFIVFSPATRLGRSFHRPVLIPRYLPPPNIHPQIYLNGELAHTHESYSGSTFNMLGATGNGITTVKLEPTGLTSVEWISLIEVKWQRVICASYWLWRKGVSNVYRYTLRPKA